MTTCAVAYGATLPDYCTEAPYHPDQRFPELPFTDTSAGPNGPYALGRALFRSLGFDSERFGSREWNPLGHLIRPGQVVLIKPNFVSSANGGSGGLFAMVTHPSIVRLLIDYAYIALRGEGRIIVADAPQMDCIWADLMAAQRLDRIQEFYHSRFRFPIEVYDLRNFTLIDRGKLPLTENRRELPGDPAGTVTINLGRRSHFYELGQQEYYGADYDREETMAHHRGETQEYCVSKTVMAADVFISVPKMKTHKKVGVTLNLKGLVGINTNKNYLVHYRLGSPSTGGDQLPDSRPGSDRAIVRAKRWAYDKLLARKSATADKVYQGLRHVYRATVKPFVTLSDDTLIFDAGNWHGNDSAWRMTADLAKILYYADRQGVMRDQVQRRIFCLVDGIIGGDRLGPLEPDARPCGCLVAGENPFAVDLVTTRLMGFDPKKLRQFDAAFDPAWKFGLSSYDDIEVRHEDLALRGKEFFAPRSGDRHLNFQPHPGWIGHIEAP